MLNIIDYVMTHNLILKGDVMELVEYKEYLESSMVCPHIMREISKTQRSPLDML